MTKRHYADRGVANIRHYAERATVSMCQYAEKEVDALHFKTSWRTTMTQQAANIIHKTKLKKQLTKAEVATYYKESGQVGIVTSMLKEKEINRKITSRI